MPHHTAMFERYSASIGRPDEKDHLATTYACMTPRNFSRAVLENAEGLAVRSVIDSGWTDLGNPERVLECLSLPKPLPMNSHAASMREMRKSNQRAGLGVSHSDLRSEIEHRVGAGGS